MREYTIVYDIPEYGTYGITVWGVTPETARRAADLEMVRHHGFSGLVATYRVNITEGVPADAES